MLNKQKTFIACLHIFLKTQQCIKMIISRTHTCFTIDASVPSRTLTRETVNLVSAAATMHTWIAGALINVYTEKQHLICNECPYLYHKVFIDVCEHTYICACTCERARVCTSPFVNDFVRVQDYFLYMCVYVYVPYVDVRECMFVRADVYDFADVLVSVHECMTAGECAYLYDIIFLGAFVHACKHELV